MAQEIIYTLDTAGALERTIENASPAGVFLLADSNTEAIARRLIYSVSDLTADRLIVIPAGDDHKSLDSLAHVWTRLSELGATRGSMLINIGGGVVTDLGGFAAATFKRGMRFVNVPTTLLAAVDAAVGGKTGINFAGLKNEIGCFHEADAVIISTEYFDSLPREELLSGYAEMLKHALLSGPEALSRALAFDFEDVDLKALLPLLQESVEVKREVVTKDPTEKGLRKSLNLGHTGAHAFEALSVSRDGRAIAHGHAVAWGLVLALVLSHMEAGLDSATLRSVATFVEANYPKPAISCNDYEALISFMRHDKKNLSASEIRFTLLQKPGLADLDHTVDPAQIKVALDLTRDLLKI